MEMKGDKMRKLAIQNEMVRMNVALVIETVRRRRLSKEERAATLSFVIDRRTGAFQAPPTGPAEDYKLFELHLDLNKREAYITETEQGVVFNESELDKKSRQVLSETCHQLKLILGHLHSIQDLGHLELDPSLEGIKGRSLLHESWHALDREDAERVLLNTTPGTYLFRKDRFAGCLEEILAAAKKSRIKCYTLTYVDPKGQVRDKTMVHWDTHWLFYDDDPKLSGNYYSSLEELLLSMGAILKRPLEALKIKQ
jgi:hypothetical protein